MFARSGDPESPGFKNIIIRPHPGGEMNDVSASHESPYGLIKSEWDIKKNNFTLNDTIPVNTTATVYIPSTKAFLKINGVDLPNNEVVKDAGLDYHFLKTNIGSGKYIFETEYEL